jgi:hypothetical protein
MSPYNRPPRARRGSRGIALLIPNLGARRGWVVSTTPRPLYPLERSGTRCTGGWVGPRAGLDVCEKSRPHRNTIPGPSSSVAIPTELPGPLCYYNCRHTCFLYGCETWSLTLREELRLKVFENRVLRIFGRKRD